MNTKIPALIPAIFTTLSVCLAGSGITSGSSVAAAKWIKKNQLLKEANNHRKRIIPSNHPPINTTCLLYINKNNFTM